MGGMRETADDRMYDLLVRVMRAQRRRRDCPRYDESADLPRAEAGAPVGTEQDPRRA